MTDARVPGRDDADPANAGRMTAVWNRRDVRAGAASAAWKICAKYDVFTNAAWGLSCWIYKAITIHTERCRI
jgi:hypothetical protein